MSRRTNATGGQQAKHEAIAAALRAMITRGGLQPGDRLPSKAELSEMYGAHFLTVRRALKTLAAEGLVRTVPRSGTFVAQVEEILWDMSAPDPWDAAILNGATGAQDITVTTVPPDARIAGRRVGDLLSLGDDELVVCRLRRRSVNGSRAVLDSSYVPYALAKDTVLMSPGEVARGVQRALEGLGYRPDGEQVSIYSRHPAPHEADELDLTPAATILEWVRCTFYSPVDTCLEVRHSVYAAGPGKQFAL